MAAFLPRPDPTRTFVRIFDKESDKESPHKKGMRFLAEPVRVYPGEPATKMVGQAVFFWYKSSQV